MTRNYTFCVTSASNKKIKLVKEKEIQDKASIILSNKQNYKNLFFKFFRSIYLSIVILTTLFGLAGYKAFIPDIDAVPSSDLNPKAAFTVLIAVKNGGLFSVKDLGIILRIDSLVATDSLIIRNFTIGKKNNIIDRLSSGQTLNKFFNLPKHLGFEPNFKFIYAKVSFIINYKYFGMNCSDIFKFECVRDYKKEMYWIRQPDDK